MYRGKIPIVDVGEKSTNCGHTLTPPTPLPQQLAMVTLLLEAADQDHRSLQINGTR